MQMAPKAQTSPSSHSLISGGVVGPGSSVPTALTFSISASPGGSDSGLTIRGHRAGVVEVGGLGEDELGRAGVDIDDGFLEQCAVAAAVEVGSAGGVRIAFGRARGPVRRQAGQHSPHVLPGHLCAREGAVGWKAGLVGWWGGKGDKGLPLGVPQAALARR